MKPKIVLVGESGSGKNTIQDFLVNKYGLKPLLSYTTREKRFPSENTHTFITNEEYSTFKPEDIIAYTYYANNHYFATLQQFNSSDVYIVDVAGLKCLKEKCKVLFISFYIHVPELIRIERMKNRGDTDESITKRLAIDQQLFSQARDLCDYILVNDDSEQTAERIMEFREGEIK